MAGVSALAIAGWYGVSQAPVAMTTARDRHCPALVRDAVAATGSLNLRHLNAGDDRHVHRLRISLEIGAEALAPA